MTTRHSTGRTLVAGIGGGLGFLLGTSLTFALLGGSRRGETGVLFDPGTQHAKVIAVWKEIEPLPRIVDTPIVILAGMVAFGVAHAFLYRWVAPAWPAGTQARALRLGAIVWLGTVFAEFIGPFNTLHQPLYLSVVAWSFWAVAAGAEAVAIVAILGRGSARAGGDAAAVPASEASGRH